MIVWPGLRRSVSAISRLFNSASFAAPLTHSAIPTRAASGTTGTFTRATTKTVENNDGYLVTLLAGEIGFPGARRIENLIVTTDSSEDMTLSNTTLFPVIVTPNDITPPAGYSRADKQTSNNPSNRSGAAIFTRSVPAGSIIGVQCVAKAGSGRYLCFGDQSDSNWHVATLDTQTGAVTTTNGGGSTSYDGESEDLGDGWWKIKFKFTKDVTGAIALLCCHADTATNGAYPFIAAGEYWWATGFQAENLTAQTTQTAGEYVSVGVESAPYYHGSFVDGVKCFPTDLSGNPIPSTTLLGYQAQGTRTNLCLQSNAFNTTWIDNGGVLTCTQNVVGPDGGTTAWTMTDDNASAIEGRAQAITLTAAAHTFSVFVKKTSGATTFPAISALVGAVFAGATIDTNNGTATVWASFDALTPASGMSARCYSHNTNFWRAELTFTGTAASWTFMVCPAEASTGTQSAFTSAGAAAVTGSAVFYGAQVELGSFASSYIPTTTIAVARNADVLTYSSSGNIDGTKGWCYAEVAANWSASPTDPKAIAAFQSSIDYGLWYLTSANNLTLTDGAAAAGAEKSFTILPTAQKVAATWSSAANSSLGAAQGVAGGADTFGTAFAPDQIGVGIYRNGTVSGEVHWFGTIRNVRIGQRQLSASELQAITA